jgi:hypothetical protein
MLLSARQGKMARCVLDCKSGKVMPWTALQTAAYSLLNAAVTYDDEGHRYTFSGQSLPSVTGILLAEGFIDAQFYTEYGRTRGSYVHQARHLDDSGELDESTIDPVIAPFLEAWRRFKRESGFIVEQSEVPMANTVYGYAGRPDVIGHFPSGNLKRGAVELHDNGKFRLISYTDRGDMSLWLAVLAVHNWKRNHMKGREA